MQMRSFCLILLLFALPVAAAELPVGDWSGTYSFADDDTLQVKYQVVKLVPAQDQSVWAITMTAAEVSIQFSDIKLSDNQLSFHMNPGEEVACLLKPGEGGIYKGECSSLDDSDKSQTIEIFMRPPPAESLVEEAPVSENEQKEDEEKLLPAPVSPAEGSEVTDGPSGDQPT